MFQDRSLTLFKVRGVPIRAHWTLLLILPYLAVVLSMQFRGVAELAGVEDRALLLPPLVWGAILAVGLFASVTVHELAHTMFALRFGGSVRSITLMLVGGVSQMTSIPKKPYQEAVVAVVGPLTSLLLGVLFLIARREAHHGPADVQMALFYLGAMNVTLGVFNLLPAFPMDGGRIVRAALASRMDRARATTIAGAIGKICAVALGVFGLLVGNILAMIVAVFIYTGAQGEVVQERMRGALEGLRIIDLLPTFPRPPPVVGDDDTLATALARMREVDRLELVVLDSNGKPTSALQAADLQAMSQAAREATTVGDLVSQLPVRHVIVPWELPANEAIQRAAEINADVVIVVDPHAPYPDDLVGLIAADDISRMVKLQLLLRRQPRDQLLGST